jgi:hypothetical protein
MVCAVKVDRLQIGMVADFKSERAAALVGICNLERPFGTSLSDPHQLGASFFVSPGDQFTVSPDTGSTSRCRGMGLGWVRPMRP